MKNPNCDNDKCIFGWAVVKVLPLGKEKNHGNIIVCHECFKYEIAWRKERNRELEKKYKFNLPKWEDLKTYNMGE